MNRIPFGINTDDQQKEEFDQVDLTGGRRRLRPINRVTQPRRLRPFNEETTSPNLVVTEDPIVPTAPAVTRDRIRVQDLLAQSLVLSNNNNQPQSEPSTIGKGPFMKRNQSRGGGLTKR